MKNNWIKKVAAKAQKGNGKVLLVSIVFLLFSLFLFFNRDLFKLIIAGDAEAIIALLTGNSSYVYLFMWMIMVIQNSFTIIPLILVITINISLFGIVAGFVWSWVTSVTAALIVFICARYLFQEKLIKRVDSNFLTKIEQKGFSYVFQARIFPFVPTSLINILAGLSTISFKHFLLATTFGNFLYFLVLSLIPAGILSSKLNEVELGMLLFLVVAIFFVFKKFYNNKRRQYQSEAAGMQQEEK